MSIIVVNSLNEIGWKDKIKMNWERLGHGLKKKYLLMWN